MPDPTKEELRAEIKRLTAEYHRVAFAKGAFRPGEDPVPVSGMVFDADDMEHLVDASLDFWLTTGRFADQFEREFPRFVGVRECSLVNSGSSANLLALTALTSPQLNERRLMPGDEVITVAAGFPTTVNPIVQNGLVPVFVDVKVPIVQHRRRAPRRSGRAAHARHHDRAHDGQSVRPRTRSPRSRNVTISGSSRTAATPSARRTRDGRSARSAISRR